MPCPFWNQFQAHASIAMSAEAPRLNRYLAACGLGSRRGVEALVADGRVSIDGVVAASPGQRVPDGAHVTFDGRPVAPDPHAYVLLHKPADVVTTVRDTHGRRTVVDLVGADRRLFPVGRLDADTTGLLLLTNDGELAARLMHPRHGVEKTYEATVVGEVRPETAATLAAGIELDGRRTAPARVRILRASPRQSVVEIVLHEGRKRQVRRMCEAVGHHVLSLHRSGYAGLRLGALAPGASRPLRPSELELLRNAAQED
jgi:23S rRNA pseudouridine2605 synthase